MKIQFQNCVERMKTQGLEVCGDVNVLDQKQDTKKTLLVTDTMFMVKKAQELQVPVLVVLHKNNKNVSFLDVHFYIEGFEDAEYSYFDRIYCRGKGLPWTVMDTERLRIREETVEDVEELYRIYREPEITRYMEDLFPTIEEEKHYAQDYRKYVYEFYDFGIWVLEELDTGTIIGRAGIEYKEELGSDCAELGFVIEKAKQGKGYAREACEAILHYAKEELGLTGIYASANQNNTASIKLLLRLGFCKKEEPDKEIKELHLLKKEHMESFYRKL